MSTERIAGVLAPASLRLTTVGHSDAGTMTGNSSQGRFNMVLFAIVLLALMLGLWFTEMLK